MYCFHYAVGAFSDFGEFNVSHDHFFNSVQSPTNNSSSMNNSASNFPIGTFSIEQTTQPQQLSTPSQQPFPTTDYFNPATAVNLMGNGINGTGPSTFNNVSNNINHINNNNNAGTITGDQPNQATRETGIIEKLLVG